jgi:hypothetical protein
MEGADGRYKSWYGVVGHQSGFDEAAVGPGNLLAAGHGINCTARTGPRTLGNHVVLTVKLGGLDSQQRSVLNAWWLCLLRSPETAQLGRCRVVPSNTAKY